MNWLSLLGCAGSGGLVNQVGSVGGGTITVTDSGYPAVDVSGGTSQFSYTTTQITAFTEVTSDLYYSGGYLGTLKIPYNKNHPERGVFTMTPFFDKL